MTLHRIKNQNSVLGGVCNGISSYYQTDLTLVRVVFVILFFTPIPIFIIYLIMWVFLPETNQYLSTDFENNNFENNFKPNYIMSNQKQNGNVVGGLILVILGAIFSFKTFFDINLFSYMKNMWPLILIGLGIWLIVREKDDNNYHGPSDNLPTNQNY